MSLSPLELFYEALVGVTVRVVLRYRSIATFCKVHHADHYPALCDSRTRRCHLATAATLVLIARLVVTSSSVPATYFAQTLSSAAIQLSAITTTFIRSHVWGQSAGWA